MSQSTCIDLTGSCVVYAGVGAAAAALFTAISPVGGAIFGASGCLGIHATRMACTALGLDQRDTMAKIIKFALTVLGGVGTAVLTTSLLGFSMTFATGAILSIGMLGLYQVACLLLGLFSDTSPSRNPLPV